VADVNNESSVDESSDGECGDDSMLLDLDAGDIFVDGVRGDRPSMLDSNELGDIGPADLSAGVCGLLNTSSFSFFSSSAFSVLLEVCCFAGTGEIDFAGMEGTSSSKGALRSGLVDRSIDLSRSSSFERSVFFWLLAGGVSAR
jgi:hypothetical protein